MTSGPGFKAPAWALDARWQRAQDLAARGELLQAEVLLRSLWADHPQCGPAALILGQWAAQRDDFEQATVWLTQAVRLLDDSPEAAMWLAQVQLAQGHADRAEQGLRTLLQARPQTHEAWLMVADLCDARAEPEAALRARFQGIARARRSGRWTSPQATEPHLLAEVERHLQRLTDDRRERLHAVLAEVRARHGERTLPRVERALANYLGDEPLTPPHAKQRPKFFYVPDLPGGPYYDPHLHAWASSLQVAWRAIRDEALQQLASDGQYESFLGLTPGQSQIGYVGGANPKASWDAYFFYRHGQRHDAHHAACPQTSALLDAADLCRIPGQAPEICFSVIQPQTTIEAHHGVTNMRLVMHLPLLVPPDCALNLVGVGTHAWREGEPMMFDDSFEHEAWNHSQTPRVILLMDCWHPALTVAERDALTQLVGAIDSIEN